MQENADKPSELVDVFDPPTAQSTSDRKILDKLLEEKPSECSEPQRDGFFIASIASVDEQGAPYIIVPGVLHESTKADAMCDVSSVHVGDQFGLMFRNGDLAYPVLMGKMQQPTLVLAAEADAQISGDKDQVIIESQKEIYLRCGDSHLLLSADGHVEIRGKTVVTHSTGLNRVRGASVKIN